MPCAAVEQAASAPRAVARLRSSATLAYADERRRTTKVGERNGFAAKERGGPERQSTPKDAQRADCQLRRRILGEDVSEEDRAGEGERELPERQRASGEASAADLPSSAVVYADSAW